MAYYSVAQADTFFTSKSTSGIWDSLSDAQKGVVLERASLRFDALPWPEDFDTQVERTDDGRVEGAFYELVRHYVSVGDNAQFVGSRDRGQRGNQDGLPRRVPLGFMDLPVGVVSRLITIFPELSDVEKARKATGQMVLPSADAVVRLAGNAGLTTAQVNALIQAALDAQPEILGNTAIDSRIGEPFKVGTNIDTLPELGVSDLAPGDSVLVADRSKSNIYSRTDFGDLTAYFQENTFDGDAVRDVVEGQIQAGTNITLVKGTDAQNNKTLSISAAGGGTTGLTEVDTDATLTGDGTSSDALKVANPFTEDDETKLDGIEKNAKDDQTPTEIRDALVGLTGAARLPATAVRDLPAAQTATEIRDSLQTLRDADRLDASAVKNLPTGGGMGRPPTEQETYDNAKNIIEGNSAMGVQWGNNDATRKIQIEPVLTGGKIYNDSGITTLVQGAVAVWARVSTLVGATLEKMQHILLAFKGGGWADAAGAGDSGTTHIFVAEELSTTPYTASNIATATWGQRYNISPRRENVYGRLRVPLVIKTPLARIRFRAGVMDAHDPDDSSELYFPLSGLSPIAQDATYSYYQVGPIANIPEAGSIQGQIFTPFELDDNYVQVPEVPAAATIAEAEAGLGTDTRLWSPARIREAIAAFVTGSWIRDRLAALAGTARLSYSNLRDTPRDRLAVVEVKDGPGQGLAIPNSSNSGRTGLFAVDTTFDMDESTNQHGVVEVDVVITMSGRTSTTVGFDQETSDPLLTVNLTGFTTVSRIRAFEAYTGSNATKSNGVMIGEATVFNGSGNLGTVQIWVGHDSNNVLSAWMAYEGNSGALGFNLASTSVELIVIHNDSEVAASPAFTHVKLTQTEYDALSTKDSAVIYLISG